MRKHPGYTLAQLDALLAERAADDAARLARVSATARPVGPGPRWGRIVEDLWQAVDESGEEPQAV